MDRRLQEVVMAMRIFSSAILAVVCGGCLEQAPGPPYRAEVLAYSGFDGQAQAPAYELGVRELGTLADLDTLEGRWFTMRRGGELVFREVAGELVTDGRFVGGQDLALRYLLEGEVMVARDYTTLGLLSAFHEMEQVFTLLGEATGVTADQLAERGRFEVFFEPRVRGLGATVTQKANAFFVPNERQFGLARRSQIETIPLAVDRLVIAHEVGHALFEHLVFGGASPTCEPGAVTFEARLRHEYVMAGINEGFADWVSFSITGSTNPLASLPFVGDERSLMGATFQFAALYDDAACGGRFYCVGTLFARSLHRLFVDGFDGADATSATSRGAFTTLVTEALAQAPGLMRSRDSLPPISAYGERCGRSSVLVPAYDGLISGAFLDAFAASLPAELQPKACATFVAGFGVQGFPTSNRITCAGEDAP